MDQKDWDLILLTICHREVELGNRLIEGHWRREYRDELEEELEKLKILKKKVIDKIR